MISEAILQYWSKSKSEDIVVKKGDVVISRTSEFDLTEGREYEVVKINWINEIAVINNIGDESIYTVEHFRLK